ncbi:unnamed protein product [Ectocarpus sp. 12 AP-2014]
MWLAWRRSRTWPSCARPVNRDLHFPSRAWRVSACSMATYFASRFVSSTCTHARIVPQWRTWNHGWGVRVGTGTLLDLGPSPNASVVRLRRCVQSEKLGKVSGGHYIPDTGAA